MRPSPGPWRWDDGSDEGYALWDATNNLVLATYEPIGQPHKKDPQRVDTRALIAASPEMREMLLKLEWVRHCTVGIEYNEYTPWFCPCCGGERDELGHDKDGEYTKACALAALLGRIR